MHQEIDSLGVQNKHILGFTYCYTHMKLISFFPPEAFLFDPLVAMYLHERCAALAVTGIKLTFPLY